MRIANLKASPTPVKYMRRKKNESLELINLISNKQTSFDSCNLCKRLGVNNFRG